MEETPASYLIQILLPVRTSEGAAFPRALYQGVAAELTERYGGVTGFTRSPGEGLWLDESEGTHRDDVIVCEVMIQGLDLAWWGQYRRDLERRFGQDLIVMRATSITQL